MPVYDLREKFYETINGEKILFASDTIDESLTTGNLLILLGKYVEENRRGFIFSHLVTHFSSENIFIPDIIFIDASKKKFVTENPYGKFNVVPDMVAEILSRSTMKRDIGIKKDVYERNGVKEYWIINPWSESIEVYLLRDGKYFLDDVYQNWSEHDLEERALLPEEEQPEVATEIPVKVLDGFSIKIKNIFGRYFE